MNVQWYPGHLTLRLRHMAWIPLYIHSNRLRPFLLPDETKSGKWLKPQPDASDEIFPFYISNAGKPAVFT